MFFFIELNRHKPKYMIIHNNFMMKNNFTLYTMQVFDK